MSTIPTAQLIGKNKTADELSLQTTNTPEHFRAQVVDLEIYDTPSTFIVIDEEYNTVSAYAWDDNDLQHPFFMFETTAAAIIDYWGSDDYKIEIVGVVDPAHYGQFV